MNYNTEGDYHKMLSWCFSEKAKLQRIAELYGSNFQKNLINLFRAADDCNSFKLLVAFETDFRKLYNFEFGDKIYE